MAFEFLTKETLLGLGGALSVGVNGWMAFSRYWISNRAKNANDSAQVNMLEWQNKEKVELKDENQKLRLRLDEKDERLQQHWKTIVDNQAQLQIIESSMKVLKEQNQLLTEQVKELTQSNINLTREVTQLRDELRDRR